MSQSGRSGMTAIVWSLTLFILSCGAFGIDQVHAASVVDCQTGQASRNYVFTLDPQGAVAGRAFAADSIRPEWLNAAAQVVAQKSWTREPTNYIVASDPRNFIVRTRTCSRDMEVETWVRNGYVFLRYDQASGRGLYFNVNGETKDGLLEIGIVVGAGEESYRQGSFYKLYQNVDLVGTAGYIKGATDGNSFTFGVEGFDVYAKFNGREFVRFKEYRAMNARGVAFKAPQGYGFRRITVRHRDPIALFSDYAKNSLDLRDFGLRSIKARGTIPAGSNRLSLASAASQSFRKGDSVIVEVGGEAGMGKRGTVGVGGTWPKLRYADLGSMEADQKRVNGTYAWLESDGSVYRWWNGQWSQIPLAQYYYSKVYPLALKATVGDISADGRVLTLDSSAMTAATNATVYLDNADVFNKLGRRPQYDGQMNWPKETVPNDLGPITPSIEIRIPPGEYAISGSVTFRFHDGWRIVGAGAGRTKIISPRGVPSANILILDSADNEVRDLQLEGNAQDDGYGLNVSETSVPQGVAFPGGIVFRSARRGLVEDVVVTNVFTAAVGAAFTTDVWARRVRNVMTDGLRMYVQWQFQWSDSTGGGCEDCSVESPTLLGGFETFKSKGTQFVRVSGTNATMSANNAGEWLFDAVTVKIRAAANRNNAWFSVHNPIVNVNTNAAGGDASAGGMARNVVMLQEGFVNGPDDPNHDSLFGIVVNKDNPNVRILGGLYSAPNLARPTAVRGAVGVNSTGRTLSVEDFEVIGKADPEWGNIRFTDGTVKNCIADDVHKAGEGGNVVVENCWPNSTPPSSVTDLTAQVTASRAVELTWTAPGGWANLRAAEAYDVRFSRAPLTEESFTEARQARGVPQPRTVGTREKYTLTGLDAGTSYYVAMKSRNGAGVVSSLSNVVSVTTTSESR